MKEEILKKTHDSIEGGHMGVSRTIEKTKRIAIWKGMSKYIKRYVETCADCQRNKSDRKKSAGLMELYEEVTDKFQESQATDQTL